MKLSIIVPIFNSEKHLSRCINSILSQTYQNLEIILINDGSKDNSLTICNEFAAIDNRILIINQENHGQAHARNAGLKIASGNYIGFIDSDDFIDIEMYSNLVKVAEDFKPDIIVSNYKLFNSKNNSFIEIKSDIPYGKLLDKNDIIDFLIKPYYTGKLGVISSLCNKIYKSDFIKINKLLIDERGSAEDYWFNFYALKIAATVFAIDKAYYNYFYLNKGSVMNSFRENQFDYYLKSRQELKDNNVEFKFDLDSLNFGGDFYYNTNAYILLCIKKKGFYNSYQKVRLILNNEEFKNVFLYFIPNRIHTKIIKKLLNLKLYLFVFFIYYVWSKK
jgi:glycosyltransferase involved in cell wall biosynthesis